ncbi:MAG: ABC transporter permease, partial [Verrucomicrobia bacterium]|nr:ABC transporter permease [Verrucomicrobiota bacterium]
MQKLKKIWAVPEIGILLPLLLCVAFFTWVSPAFLGPESVRAILRALAFVGLIAVGQTFLMIAGEIDLSVGSVAGFCAIASAWLMKTAHWPAAAAIVAAVTLGAALGLVNGWVTVRIGIPAFITTLGMLYIAKGLNYLLCKGYPIYPLPASVQDGRKVYATGGNREVAHLAGIHTEAVKIGCFVLCGALAAVGGILLMAQINVGQPEIGVGWELDVIASTVIGGVSLFGGVGTVVGTFLGLLLMQVIRTGLVTTGVNTHWQTVAV